MVKHNEKADLDLNTNDLSQGVCRICYYDEESGPFGEANKNGSRLINACECSGTSGLYHRYCIEEWVKSSACNQPLTCEICNTPYKFKIYFPNLYRYFKDENTKIDVNTILFATLIFITSNLIVFYLCFTLIPFIYEHDRNKFEKMSFIYEFCIKTPSMFIILLLLSFFAYLIFMICHIGKGYFHFLRFNARYVIVDSNRNDSLYGSGSRMQRHLKWIKKLSSIVRNSKRELSGVKRPKDDICRSGINIGHFKNRIESQVV